MEEREPESAKLSAAPGPGYFEPDPVPPVIDEGKPARSVLVTVPVHILLIFIISAGFPTSFWREWNPDVIFCLGGITCFGVFGYWSRSSFLTILACGLYSGRFWSLHRGESHDFQFFALSAVVFMLITFAGLLGLTFGKFGRFRLSELRHMISATNKKK